jgi:hypothetical protein
MKLDPGTAASLSAALAYDLMEESSTEVLLAIEVFQSKVQESIGF